MLRKSILAAALAVALIVRSAFALGGNFQFTIRDKATSYSYEIWDKDFFPGGDDLLETGSESLRDPQPGQAVDINLKDLKCSEGEVTGPAGTSGEKTAEVYVVLTWYFDEMASVTETSPVMKVTCNKQGQGSQKK